VEHIEAGGAEPGDQRAQGLLHLDAGEARPDAEVGAPPEGEVGVGAEPGDVEGVGIGEGGGATVGGVDDDDRPIAGGQLELVAQVGSTATRVSAGTIGR
jgi:hypothetical protein